MVCAKCEKKVNKVICPDKWKAGANNTTDSGGRKVNENKLLTKRYAPYSAAKCKTCKATLHIDGMYCQTCAYKNGLCAMCGIQILDEKTLKSYKQSTK